MAAAAAAPEPEIAPNNILATTFDCASAPGIRPLITFAQFTSLCAMPPLFIMLPARMKNGIAISENELEPANILCADVAKETSAGIIHIIETADDIPMATPIGAPITSSTTNIVTITKATCNAILIFTSYSAFFLSSRPILYML